MSTHTTKGFITAYKSKFGGEVSFDFAEWEPSPDSDFVKVREHTITFEVPDDFDITAPLISQLREKQRLARLKLAAELAEIDEQISKLTCITNEVAA